MSTTTQDDTLGLVRPWERGRSFHLERRPPSLGLERLVERHWIVTWDLRDRESFRQETLPHPSVNLVVEPDGAWVWGVPTERDTRKLSGEGWAVGTKFKPGAFTAVTGIEASSITDGRLSPLTAFGASAADLGSRTGAQFDPHAVIAEIEALLVPHAAIEEPSLELVAAVIDSMRALPPDTRIEELAVRHHIAARTLQRLFRRYVGVSPKWVLKRVRVHRAVERLTAPQPPPWTELALDLGYYDHAHFIRDFRSIVGRSPAEYAAEATGSYGT